MGSRRTFAFHSYKGGSGKTTLITNIAALYAKSGLNVGLMDFDLYAPSLFSYFKKTPELYLNDLLSGDAQISDVVVDLSSELNLGGKFLVGFSSPRKEDINQIEIKFDTKWQLQALKRFLSAKRELFEEHNLDYLFLDTSPGIRYWAINILATADYLFLLLKDSDIDIEGTRKMINDIYDSLSRFGSKYYLILNKVPGAMQNGGVYSVSDEKAWIAELERVVGAKVVGSIPCFCDIQFSRHEFLFSINQPKHPFSVRTTALAETIKSLSQQ
ncbi:MAG: AAA family ATPase [Candidatus Bathyarchaeota archaeon]|nr:AAA family ATPase [Candidatus Bathyarchaeota archaeon]